MKIKIKKATTFRGKKYKKNSVIELPEGVANKMIANGLATKE